MYSLELFSGGGGLALGVERAGFNHLCLVEADRNSCETLRHNRPAWNVHCGDVRSFEYSSLAGRVDLLAGGAPCQPFSLGGKHAGKDDRRNLFPEVVRAVRETQPKAFLLENVRGLTRQGFLPYFHYILAQLKQPSATARPDEHWYEHHERLGRADSRELEYNVVFKILNAADYGVPQTRHRVLIVGFRSDLGMRWDWPPQTHSLRSLRHAQEATGEYWLEHGITPPRQEQQIVKLPLLTEARWRTVRDALHDLPDPVLGAAPDYEDHNFIAGARPYVGHTGSELDSPSKTLKAGDHGVPGGENTLTDASGRFRYLTVRESARLQTFPDDWSFRGSRTESMRQIGNAVPVRLAQYFGTAIRSALEERVATYPSAVSPSSARTASAGLIS